MATKHIPDIVVSEVLLKQMAAFCVAAPGASQKEIADKHGITLYQCKGLMAKDLFREELQKLQEELTESAKRTIKAQFASMSDEIVRVVRNKLEENDLEAVKIAIKALGVTEEEQKFQDATLHVHLPGSAGNRPLGALPTIEVEGE